MADDLETEALRFLTLFHAETPDAGQLQARADTVRAEIATTGTYRHTRSELAFGARAAWRHSVRCLGRLRWRSLVVRDARHITRARQVYQHLLAHLRIATNAGRIRPTITVFASDSPAGPRVRIWNEQLIRYAGWPQPGGAVLGDPRYAGFTTLAQRLGWRPPQRRGRFDILPWVIETVHDGLRLFTVPRPLVLEVPLSHPDYAWFTDLGLRWHALPVISHMRLRIGGVDYSCAPFNGWYLGDEIGSRNLSDHDRYNQVPVVAARMGLDTGTDRTLWRDRAVIEINRAVLHSFDVAGVRIVDHHHEAANFMRFVAAEQQAGREAYAEWSWINSHPVPPQTPTFHRYYRSDEVEPNFWLDDAARRHARGDDHGPTLREFHQAATGNADGGPWQT